MQVSTETKKNLVVDDWDMDQISESRHLFQKIEAKTVCISVHWVNDSKKEREQGRGALWS